MSEDILNENDNIMNQNEQNINENKEINASQEDDQIGTTPLPEKYNIKFYFLFKLFSKLGNLKP